MLPELNYEDRVFLRSILDDDDMPTDQEFEKALQIYRKAHFLTVKPRATSQKYSWLTINGHSYCANREAIFVFTNVIDAYIFSTEMLGWDPVAIDHQECRVYPLTDVLLDAKAVNLKAFFDYQTKKDAGFFFFDPKLNVFNVAVRDI